MDTKPALPGKPSIVIVDDFRLSRECLAGQLAAHYADIATAWDLPTMVREINGSATTSLVLLNIATKRSATLLQLALDLSPAPKVVVFGLSEDQESDVVSCAEAGAAGLHMRSESLEHLLELMHDVGNGHARCSSAASAILLGRVYSGAAGYRDSAGPLTARENEILALLEEGLTNKQIATRLSVTVHTVKNHVHSLLGKLGVQSRAEATRLSRAMRYAGSLAYDHQPDPRQRLNRSLSSVH